MTDSKIITDVSSTSSYFKDEGYDSNGIVGDDDDDDEHGRTRQALGIWQGREAKESGNSWWDVRRDLL